VPISIPRLRTWFALIAIATVLLVAGFYVYAQYRLKSAVRDLPKKLGVDIQQSTEGFTLSKSEGGRTLFTIRASRAVQYKQGGRAQLSDVNIVVYGRDSNRYDQIYGSGFDYDPQAGTVAATGEVHIDLQAVGDPSERPDQAPPKELKNPIHLKTSGLVFNQKTGIAHTGQVIEFRVPQAEGSATGATYDSRANVLTLESKVDITTTDDRATNIKAARGTITKVPQQQIILESVRVDQRESSIEANRVNVLVRDDNTIGDIVATGNVRLRNGGENPTEVTAPRADLKMGGKNSIENAVLSGGVQMNGRDQSGNAGRVTILFAPNNKVRSMRASGDVVIRQQSEGGKNPQAVEIASGALDLSVVNGRLLQTAQTSGAAQITITPLNAPRAGERTVVTADRFVAQFERNRLSSVRGENNARVVATVPGQPDKVSTSRTMLAQFAAGGGIANLQQEGDFEYREGAMGNSGERRATAHLARYTPQDESLQLTGLPRVVEGGLTITARSLRINRRSGDAFAQGAVKTTYSDIKPNPEGAMLARSEPVHVTSRDMSVNRQSGVARYTGGARLWQGANIVEAPTIEFDRTRRSVVAQGAPGQPVTCVFVQADNAGRTTPVVLNAANLSYLDSDRRARFTGGVTARGADVAISAGRVDVVLQPATQKQAAPNTPSQLQQIIADKNVNILQTVRRAAGDRLVYSAQEGRFVLSGGPPTITDPERGVIRGDSLTFYSRDDRVVVESAGTSRTVTRTRIRQ